MVLLKVSNAAITVAHRDGILNQVVAAMFKLIRCSRAYCSCLGKDFHRRPGESFRGSSIVLSRGGG